MPVAADAAGPYLCIMKRTQTRFTLRLLGCLALGAMLAAGCADTAVESTLALSGSAIEPGECTGAANEQELVVQVLKLVNEERGKIGIPPVALNSVLSRVADDYACLMIHEDFFSHRDPDGYGPGERAIQGGYIFLRLGENLAAGQTTPEQAMEEWMSSEEGHRENILAPEWTEIGVAVRLGGEHGIYWVQEFGLPPGASNSVNTSDPQIAGLGR